MQKRVIALGFFDGVHLGHGALMKQAVQKAGELGVGSAAFTFDRLPRGAVTGAQVPLINSTDDRCKLICRLYGVDEVITMPFDDSMRTMPWETFVEELLVQQLGACHLVVGDDHRFGYRGEGTPEKLQQKCREMGLGCDVIEQVEVQGERVSSTRIRALIAESGVTEFFVYHPAFGYLANEYGLTMHALEQEGSEATAVDMAAMIDRAKERDIRVIFYQAETDSRQAEAFAAEIGGRAVMLSPLAEKYVENLEIMAEAIASIRGE